MESLYRPCNQRDRLRCYSQASRLLQLSLSQHLNMEWHRRQSLSNVAIVQAHRKSLLYLLACPCCRLTAGLSRSLTWLVNGPPPVLFFRESAQKHRGFSSVALTTSHWRSDHLTRRTPLRQTYKKRYLQINVTSEPCRY